MGICRDIALRVSSCVRPKSMLSAYILPDVDPTCELIGVAKRYIFVFLPAHREKILKQTSGEPCRGPSLPSSQACDSGKPFSHMATQHRTSVRQVVRAIERMIRSYMVQMIVWSKSEQT